MLTLLYPKEDYTAADVAVRVQALAAGEGQKIQVIAKHFGRNPQQVEKQLKQTTAALFIACDQLALDDNSRQELDILLAKGRNLNKKKMKRFLLLDTNFLIHIVEKLYDVDKNALLYLNHLHYL